MTTTSFNGKHGIISEIPSKGSTRYVVSLLNDSKTSLKHFSIKEENLSLPAYPQARKKPYEVMEAEFFEKYPNGFDSQTIVFRAPSLYYLDIPLNKEDILLRMSFILSLPISHDEQFLRVIRLVGSSIYQDYSFSGLSWAASISPYHLNFLEEKWDGIGEFRLE